MKVDDPFSASILDISPDRSEFLVIQNLTELWVAPLLGGAPRRLGNLVATQKCCLNSGTGYSTPRRKGYFVFHQSAAAWSPDGRQLVYARENELHLARSDGTELRKLATVTGRPFFVRWAPDGKSLRLSVSDLENDTRSSLWEVSIADGRLRPLLPGWEPSSYTCCGSWTSDGKYYVFQSRGNVWVLLEKSGFPWWGRRQPTQLTTGPMSAYWPLPSPDGKRLYIAAYQARGEFLRFDIKSNQFTPDLTGISGTQLEFSKDGKWAAYVSIPEGSLFRSTADGKERVQLTAPPLQVGLPHWSPDGKQIAFMASGRIYLVDSAGGAPQRVTNGEGGPAGDIDPSWSPDGVSIAFGGNGLVAGSIQVLNLRTNRVSTLHNSEGMWSPRWSPDGRYIAGLSVGEWKLILYDLRMGTQNEIYDRLSGYPAWSPDGQFLYSRSFDWFMRVQMRDRKVEPVAEPQGIYAEFIGLVYRDE